MLSRLVLAALAVAGLVTVVVDPSGVAPAGREGVVVADPATVVTPPLPGGTAKCC